MSQLAAAVFALAAFIAGFVLGRRSTARRHRDELARQAARLQNVIDFADDYIEANAARWRVHVVRNYAGKIIDLATRCGTSTLAARQLLEEYRRGKSLY
jgi:hypothetical protein